MPLALIALALIGCRSVPEEVPAGDDTADTAFAPLDDTGATVVRDDVDADGFLAADDCDDANPAVNPAADEVCNGFDDDCDGTVDLSASDAEAWFDDDDGDGYGVERLVSCEQPDGFVLTGGDCDDGNVEIHPGAAEVCGDETDNDCSREADICAITGVYAPGAQDLRLGGANGEGFGASVALGDFDGDGQIDLAGGAPDFAAGDAGGFGRVAVWFGPVAGSGTTANADATVASGVDDAGLGAAVAAGDHDGDGVSDLFVHVRASAYDPDGAGSVRVLYGGARWAGANGFDGAATLLGGAPGDGFGSALAVGDVDGDGVSDLLVGAGDALSLAEGAGAAQLYYGGSTRRSGVLVGGADTSVYGVGSFDALGASVALGDLTGDGFADVLLGGPGIDGAGADRGAAAVFAGGGLGFVPELAEADAFYAGAVDGDAAGTAVIALGDLDADGYDELGVYVPGYDADGLDDAGALWVYAGAAALGASPVATLHGSAANAMFGASAAGAGDVDGDGVGDLFVGAPGDAAYGAGAGAGAVFYGPVAGTYAATAANATVYAEGGAGGGLGAVLGRADLTGDGLLDLVASAPTEGAGAGAVYVWAVRGGE